MMRFSNVYYLVRGSGFRAPIVFGVFLCVQKIGTAAAQQHGLPSSQIHLQRSKKCRHSSGKLEVVHYST